MTRTKRPTVAVLGGGITGLAAAWALVRDAGPLAGGDERALAPHVIVAATSSTGSATSISKR